MLYLETFGLTAAGMKTALGTVAAERVIDTTAVAVAADLKTGAITAAWRVLGAVTHTLVDKPVLAVVETILVVVETTVAEVPAATATVLLAVVTAAALDTPAVVAAAVVAVVATVLLD